MIKTKREAKETKIMYDNDTEIALLKKDVRNG